MRPIDHAQQALITAIVRGEYPVGTALPGERDLAAQLGVTRPTLREALRRLEADGWLIIQHGKSTLVRNYLHEGGLNVLNGIVQYSRDLPPDFVPNLLQVRLDLAPSYTRLAIMNAPHVLISVLKAHKTLPDTPHAYAHYDWQLHHTLTVQSGNPIYALILNGFADFYEYLAETHYFQHDVARQASAAFYAELLSHVQAGDVDEAAALTQRVMAASITLWEMIHQTS
ncbi:MAG: fatty acid metabolism transcriptional regulator FadR [Phototrophicales bacterium]|nr:MAG: fatty acid metabolism transcriptional regulator FadR [Phototrophicales bacterium]RMG72740.1 MAG: fatty acid metabolism transcriptional regulator FadR [Chloroflexota bacterium]